MKPSDQIPMFTMQDMRFFHHFLNYCYPHYPLKQEDVWTQEIPCLAHGVSTCTQLHKHVVKTWSD